MRANALQHGRDVFVLQLAALGKQDQFVGGSALRPDAIRERDERLHGARDLRHRRDHVTLGGFDAFADLALLVRLQQAALADVLEIDADEVDILARHPSLRRLLGLLFVLVLELIVDPAVRDRLVGKRFGLVVLEQASRLVIRPTWIGPVAAVDGEAEFLGSVAPVEHVGLF